MKRRAEAAAFAVRLRDIRESAGLTIPQLAAKSGLSAQAIHFLERGERQPSLATAQRLAKALGVSVAEF